MPRASLQGRANAVSAPFLRFLRLAWFLSNMLPNADGLVAMHTWMATHTRKAAHATLLGAPNTAFAQGREPPLPKCVLSHRRAGGLFSSHARPFCLRPAQEPPGWLCSVLGGASGCSFASFFGPQEWRCGSHASRRSMRSLRTRCRTTACRSRQHRTTIPPRFLGGCARGGGRRLSSGMARQRQTDRIPNSFASSSSPFTPPTTIWSEW